MLSLLAILTDLVERGGGLVLAIFGASAVAWTIGIHTALRLRAEGGALDRLVGELGRLLDRAAATAAPRRDLYAARARCRGHGHDRVASRVLALPLVGQHPGRAVAVRDAEPLIAVEVARFRAPLRMVAALGATCPLLGLLGTVVGMIEAFQVIARSGPADPGALAGGVQTALITTEVGLVAALPVVLLSGYLRSRLGRLHERLVSGFKRVKRLVDAAGAGAGAADSPGCGGLLAGGAA